jgi:hypothetical protein
VLKENEPKYQMVIVCGYDWQLFPFDTVREWQEEKEMIKKEKEEKNTHAQALPFAHSLSRPVDSACGSIGGFKCKQNCANSEDSAYE